MSKAIVLDCGGVMVAPVTGDWLLAPTFDLVLGEGFLKNHLRRFRAVRSNHLHYLPDMIKIGSDEEEYHLFCKLYRAVFDEMEFPLSDAQIEQMAFIQTYRDDRYLLFDDVLPYLSRWRGKYKLGIVSDAPPSTRRILTQMGVMQYIDAATFSCDLGVLKPDPAIYRATLDRLQVLPGEALFVDDFPSKLRGAKALGMHCVQMRRPMPELFQTAPEWEGDMAHDFQDIDEYVNALR